MSKQYIGSQEHFEDEINAYYDQKEAYEKSLERPEQPYLAGENKEPSDEVDFNNTKQLVELCWLFFKGNGEKKTISKESFSHEVLAMLETVKQHTKGKLLGELIAFAKFVQNDYYNGGIRSADIIAKEWIDKKEK